MNKHTSNIQRSFHSHERPVDIADLIESKKFPKQREIFDELDDSLAAEVLSYLPGDLRSSISKSLEDKRLVDIISTSSPDDRLYILEALDSDQHKRVVNLLDFYNKIEVQTRLSYPPKSVGRIMTPYFVRIRPQWTMTKVLEHLRRYGAHAETFEILYVISDDDELIDEVFLKDVILNHPHKQVSDLLDGRFVSVGEYAEQEDALAKMNRFDINSLPVVNSKRKLIGIITADDILDVSENESSEDLEKFSGIEALGERYSRIPIKVLIKKRLTWLVLLFVSGILTVFAMAQFEDRIAHKAVLALFVPIIIASGGNTGTQTASLMIRAFAIRDIKLKDWKWVIKKEVISGVLISVVLGTIGFSLCYVFMRVIRPDENAFMFAISICLSLMSVITFGSFIGAILPFVLSKLKLDPSISSTPAVTTILDVSGLVMYFLIVSLILGV